MLMVVLGAILSLFVIRQGLRKIVVSLHTFAIQTEQISQGEFNSHESLDVINSLGEDNEIGQLKRSFENMRRRLKERLEELNQLLFVSQKVAATLDIREAMLPILEAILTSGADVARVVFQETFDEDEEYSITKSERLGVGNSNEDFSFLDNSLTQLLQEKDYVILTNLSRISILNVSAPQHGELKYPAMVVAFALRHKGKFYGTLWVGYMQARQVTEEDEEFRFMRTLISLASVAAANTKLFHNAEVRRQRLEAILSSSPDPVFVTDQNNRLLFINAAAVRALKDPKLPPGSLSNLTPKTGESVVDVIKHDKLVDFLIHPVDDVRTAEIRLPDRRIYVGTVTSIKTGQEKIGRVCVLKDITSYKELDSLKSEFVSTVSHDLRSPLTIIQGYLSMLDVVGSLNEYQMEYVSKIGVNIEQMLKMINEILDLDRIESSRGIQYEKIAAQEMINAVAKDFHILAAQKQIELSTEGNFEEELNFWADGLLMKQALHNLVDNAIKFTPVNGKIKISVEQQHDEIVFSVSDNGIGIAPIDQARLFDKFYKVERVNYNREEDKATEISPMQMWKPSVGLGLAIVKSIAERHQGRVWVESRLGKGSTFYFAIPMQAHAE
jgi:signal transduction histidine kinase